MMVNQVGAVVLFWCSHDHGLVRSRVKEAPLVVVVVVRSGGGCGRSDLCRWFGR